MPLQTTRNAPVTHPKRVEESLEPRVERFTTDIDDSAQTETTAFVLLTIAPSGVDPLRDVEVDFDLDKATTGLGSVETSVTLNFHVARKVDGTNWRLSQSPLAAAISGTVASAERAVTIPVGDVIEETRIYAVASGDVTADMELPGQVRYKGKGGATVTAVAAG